MKSRDIQPRLLNPARLSKIEGEIKSFPAKKKKIEFINTKPVLQEMLKGSRKRRRKRRRKEYSYIE